MVNLNPKTLSSYISFRRSDFENQIWLGIGMGPVSGGLSITSETAKSILEELKAAIEDAARAALREESESW